jgi:hypothetical protein
MGHYWEVLHCEFIGSLTFDLGQPWGPKKLGVLPVSARPYRFGPVPNYFYELSKIKIKKNSFFFLQNLEL